MRAFDLNLGWRTDLDVLRLTGSTVEDRGDHLIVRSPHSPLFHWGNFVMVLDPGRVEDAEHWLDVFAEAFPEAGHRAFGLPAMPRGDAWTRLALEVGTDEVLATSTRPTGPALPAGYAARPLLTADDWDAWVELEAAENDRLGEHPAAPHRIFLRDQAATRARLVAQGHAAWFAAYAPGGAGGPGSMVASLGVVRCGDLARYQSVGTHPEHRRRGLAGHLLGLAAAWAGERGCTTWVIVTESTNPAGRLYRAVGFAPSQESVQAYRRVGANDTREDAESA